MKAIDTTLVELRRLVSPVLPLTGTDQYMPALTVIRVRSNEGYLTADATDRYVAGVSRRPAPGVGSGFDELIRATDLRTLLRVVEPPKGKDVELRIHPADDDGTVLVEAGESRHLAATAFRFKSLGKATAVNLWALLDRQLRATVDTAPPFGINPEKLAVFDAATHPDVNEGRLPLIVRPPNNGRGAVLVACGDHFVGLVMTLLSQPETNDAVPLSMDRPDRPAQAGSEGMSSTKVSIVYRRDAAIEKTMHIIECASCSIDFGIGDNFMARRREDHKGFYCPNGHTNVYRGDNTEEKLRKELEQKERALRSSRDYAEAERRGRLKAQREKAAARGQVTKIKNRVGRGVCPCCNRSFANLGRHIAGQHPDFIGEPKT